MSSKETKAKKSTPTPKKMPKPDTALKSFLADNEIFADLFNTIMFGKEILNPADLLPADSAYAETAELSKGVEKINKYRDVIRKTSLGAQFIILGVENQNKIHYAMPLRVMLYDILGYVTEIKAIEGTKDSEKWTVDEMMSQMSEDTRLTPIFTIVFYTGEEKWESPHCLYDMLDIDDKLKPFIPDYPIKVIDVGHENFDFKSESLKDLSYVLQSIYSKEVLGNNAEVSNSMLSLAGVLTGSQSMYTKYSKSKGGKTVMCKAMKEMIDEGRKAERIDAIINLINAGQTKEFILSLKYSEEEYLEAKTLVSN